MNINFGNRIIFFLLLFFSTLNQTMLNAQCASEHGTILLTNEKTFSFDSLATLSAPLFWFSPDEPGLFDQNGQIQLPNTFPFEETSEVPVVYFKIKRIYSTQKRVRLRTAELQELRSSNIDISKISSYEIEYYCYYNEETGLGGHPHDIESVAFQIQVNRHPQCADHRFSLDVKRVIARAHGLYWFENAVNVDEQTVFPFSILVEEGKHANCTDKNADGIYTPGFDVTEKVNDAWGVRDIISTGKLFTGGFQGWMAKERTPKSLLLPPRSPNQKSIDKIKERFNGIQYNNRYVIRQFPDYDDKLQDKLLVKKIKEKKHRDWPKLKTGVSIDQNILKLSKENKLRNKWGISYRFDSESTLSFSAPLLLFRHVEAPMTGGWFYNRFYTGSGDSFGTELSTLFGHQIQHTNSASRWIDSYMGFGYEIVDVDYEFESQDFKTYLVTEIGMKIRLNITKTPLKFLKVLGTDYWGIRFGWKNLGFTPFEYSGFVVEIGAGAF